MIPLTKYSKNDIVVVLFVGRAHATKLISLSVNGGASESRAEDCQETSRQNEETREKRRSWRDSPERSVAKRMKRYGAE